MEDSYIIASKMIIDLQNKNVNLRLALLRLVEEINNSDAHKENKKLAEQIDFANKTINEANFDKHHA